MKTGRRVPLPDWGLLPALLPRPLPPPGSGVRAGGGWHPGELTGVGAEPDRGWHPDHPRTLGAAGARGPSPVLGARLLGSLGAAGSVGRAPVSGSHLQDLCFLGTA